MFGIFAPLEVKTFPASYFIHEFRESPQISQTLSYPEARKFWVGESKSVPALVLMSQERKTLHCQIS
jgi:hypothetical protein